MTEINLNDFIIDRNDVQVQKLCECNLPLDSGTCQNCGMTTESESSLDYNLFDDNKVFKYKSCHNPSKYIQSLMIELKNLSCRDYSIELKNINPKPNLSFHQFKKFIYKYHPKYKFEFRALYAKYKNLLFDQDFLNRQEIQKLGEHYKLFKRSNYFPSRCMYLLFYHNNIFEYYKEVLEPVKSNKKYIKYLNN